MSSIYKTLAFLVLLCAGQLAMAQNFITQWNLATAGSGATQLSFGTATSGVVNYTWQELSPGTATGSGSWTGAILTITGLPAGATIRLQITPTNFQRINISNGSDRNRLTQVEQWGSTAWTSMREAFWGCENLQVTATDVPNLSGVTLVSMFSGCTSLNSPSNINTWNTAAVTSMNGVFAGASAFNQNIGSWNTSAVTDMALMFSGASSFNQNIGAWNTGAVTDMGQMFYAASAFDQNIGMWNTAAVTDMNRMFYAAVEFNNGGDGSINNWNTGAVTKMNEMFFVARAFNQDIGAWNTGAVTTMNQMFAGAIAFNQNIGAWNTGAVTDMSGMFSEVIAFNQDIGSWNTAAVDNMVGMFFGARAFNKNIGSWNTSAVTNMADMFYNANAFNQDIGSWNTAAVDDMGGMFFGANSFNQNIGAWNTGAVKNMSSMFLGARSFNQDIGSWNMSAVTTMAEMFRLARDFNQDIGSWNTAAVTNMSLMFSEALAFNQNLGSWALNSGVNLSNMFDNSGMDCNSFSSTLTGWSANPLTPNGRALGATGRQYGTNAVAARTNLIATKGWTISGDTPSGAVCSSASCVPALQRAALVELYNTTDGANWTNNGNWLSADESTWFGVSVTGCNITEISLPSNNLNGYLPFETRDLLYLQRLDLSDNNLYYGIPSEIGNFNNLQYLFLQSNQLDGSIPPELSNLSSLLEVSLSNNRLSGVAPAIGLASMSMSDVSLEGNFFNELADITGYYNLNSFSIGNNSLSFEDLEPNAAVSNFTYSPQAKLPPGGIVSFTVGGNLTIPFTTPGSANSYQWYKNGVLLPGATSATLSIPSAVVGDAGTYHVLVNNSIATGVTLQSYDYVAIADPCTSATRTAGFIDATFQPNFDNPTSVSGVAIQSTGKIIAAVPNTTVGGVPVFGTIRFNSNGTLDGTFNQIPEQTIPLIQPDDKILGYANDQVIRYNADGTDDFAFNNNAPQSYSSSLSAMALQPDGKIIYSNTSYMGGMGISRLNADGTTDLTFANLSFLASAIEVQADGKILIAAASGSLNRLNPNGSADASFDAGSTTIHSISDLLIQPDGKIIAVGKFTSVQGSNRFGIVRLNANGSLDGSFVAQGIANLATLNGPYRIALMSNGKLIVAGDFANVNGSQKKNLVRLNTDGTVDCSFDPGLSSNVAVSSIAIQPDSKILISGDFVSYDGTSRYGMGRINNDVAIPTITNFTPTSGPIGTSVTITGTNFSTTPANNSVQFNGITAYVVSSSATSITAIVPPGATTGSISVTVSSNTATSASNFTIVPFACPPGTRQGGGLDTSFNPLVQSPASFTAVELQSTGKSIVATPSAIINGSSYDGLLRFNPDGSLDNSFASSLSYYPNDRQLKVLPNDKILVVEVATVSYIKRLNEDGSTDNTFNSPGYYASTVFSLGYQTDAKVLLSIYDDTAAGVFLYRLNEDGTLDNSFTPLPDFNANIILQQADGKILAAGPSGVIRVEQSGSIDPTFATINPLDGDITEMVIQSNGKIVLVGSFTKIAGFPARNIARLNSDGTIDTSFLAGNGFSLYAGSQPSSIKLLAGDRLLVAGEFTTYNDEVRTRLLMLNADGSLYCSFDPQLGSDAPLVDAAVQPDGKILIVGSFSNYDGTARNAFARVNGITASCVPAIQRAALIALYNATNGASWTNNTNWLSADESTWYGVTIIGCNVTRIDLGGNNMLGSLPVEIGNLTSLTHLNLGQNLGQNGNSTNVLSGAIPASIGNLTNLQVLYLSVKQLSGSLPVSIGNLASLRDLDLGDNQFTGNIPSSWFNLTQLETLILSRNSLSGTLSPQIGQLAALKTLQIGTNQFSGSLPPEIGNLTQLVSLVLDANQFTGSIPSSFGNLTNMQFFGCSVNQLSGNLPASLSNLSNLVTFVISLNQFTGDLPAAIGTFPNLFIVNVRGNQFTSIPPFVSTALVDLRVFDNRLNFGHLEPNIGKTGFVYSPQDNLPGGAASACVGTTLTINFSTPGTANSYQWYKDGVLITGATSTNFVKANVTAADAGNYTVQVSNSIVTGLILQSDNFVVTVNSIPGGPVANAVSVCPAGTATLTATGGTTGQYRWYNVASGGTAITGQTNSTFVTPGISVVTTFYVSVLIGTCESARTAVVVTPIASACAPPTIASTSISITIGNNKTLDLKTLITTPSGTIDINSITVTVPPPSGAIATINGGVLTLDYKGVVFAGKEKITIRACDTNGNCSTQQIEIEVVGEIVIYNAVSPNGDGKNDFLVLQYIESISPKNQVSFYNRWGDEVFSISDYDNKTRVFAGLSSGGSKLPSGTYFYKVNLIGAGKTLTGFILLKN